MRVCHFVRVSDILSQLYVYLKMDDNDLRRRVSFTPGLKQSLQPATTQLIRRRGRPRKEWIPEILDELRRRELELFWTFSETGLAKFLQSGGSESVVHQVLIVCFVHVLLDSADVSSSSSGVFVLQTPAVL